MKRREDAAQNSFNGGNGHSKKPLFSLWASLIIRSKIVLIGKLEKNTETREKAKETKCKRIISNEKRCFVSKEFNEKLVEETIVLLCFIKVAFEAQLMNFIGVPAVPNSALILQFLIESLQHFIFLHSLPSLFPHKYHALIFSLCMQFARHFLLY